MRRTLAAPGLAAVLGMALLLTACGKTNAHNNTAEPTATPTEPTATPVVTPTTPVIPETTPTNTPANTPTEETNTPDNTPTNTPDVTKSNTPADNSSKIIPQTGVSSTNSNSVAGLAIVLVAALGGAAAYLFINRKKLN